MPLLYQKLPKHPKCAYFRWFSPKINNFDDVIWRHYIDDIWELQNWAVRVMVRSNIYKFEGLHCFFTMSTAVYSVEMGSKNRDNPVQNRWDTFVLHDNSGKHPPPPHRQCCILHTYLTGIVVDVFWLCGSTLVRGGGGKTLKWKCY